jgi:RNAse (barnase) inhibitor barstar
MMQDVTILTELLKSQKQSLIDSEAIDAVETAKKKWITYYKKNAPRHSASKDFPDFYGDILDALNDDLGQEVKQHVALVRVTAENEAKRKKTCAIM